MNNDFFRSFFAQDNQSESEYTAQARNAFWVSLTMAALLTASLINSALTGGFTKSTWSSVVLIGIALVTSWLSRINRHQLGIWLLVLGVFAIALLQPFVSAGQGVVIGVAVAIVAYGIASSALPVTQVTRVALLAVLVGVVVMLLDLFGPAGRPEAANPLQTTVISIIFIVIFGVLVARQRTSPLAQFLSNISIAWKMGLMAFVLLAALVGVASTAYAGLQSLRYQLSNIYDFMLVPIVAINHADTALADTRFHLEQLHVAETTASERTKVLQNIQSNETLAADVIARYDTEWVTTASSEFTQALKEAGKLDLQQQEVAALEAFHVSFEAYKAAAAKYLATVQVGNPDASLANDAIAKLEFARADLQTLIDINNAYADFSNGLAQTALQQSTLNTSIVLAMGLVLSLLISYLIAISFIGRLNELNRGAVAIQGGRLDQAVVVTGRDEVSLLGKAFNQMASQLSEFIGTLEQRVEARTKDLATVAEVGTATATILESKRLLQEVVELTRERFKLYHSHIYLLDEKGENLVLTAGAGEPGRVMVAEGRSIPLSREQSLVARAARERKGVTVNDVTQAPDFLPNPMLPDTRSELAVPMIVGGRVIGVFDIQSDQVGRFTDSDINIQTTLAAQLATSIQNVRSFEKSKKQADFESLVNTIGQKIQRSTTVEDTLQIAIREVGIALSASSVRASLSRSDDNENLVTSN